MSVSIIYMVEVNKNMFVTTMIMMKDLQFMFFTASGYHNMITTYYKNHMNLK